MKNLKLTRPITFMDIETTGLNFREDRIVDICITKVFPDGKEETLNTIINPTIPISAESTQIHGITDADVQGKPTFSEFAQKILAFISNCDWGGFNIIGFDLKFLEEEFKRTEIAYSNEGRKVIDVMKIYHKLDPRDLNSAHLKYCGSLLESSHGSHRDVKATIDVLDSQLERHSDLPTTVSALHELCNPKNPSWIDNDGKLSWLNGNAAINFGKHTGKTLEEMYKTNPDYLQWMINADFSPKVKNILKEVLTGKVPQLLKK